MNSRLFHARLLFWLLLGFSLQAHAIAGEAKLVEAKKMTRCAWMVISSGSEAKAPDSMHKHSVSIVSSMLIDRAWDLGALRPLQETWMTEVARQVATATLVERLQLFVEWTQCRVLMKKESERASNAAKDSEN